MCKSREISNYWNRPCPCVACQWRWTSSNLRFYFVINPKDTLKVPWTQNWIFLGASINMLVLRLSVCQCAPKQWQHSHLEDISVQSLKFVTSANSSTIFLTSHRTSHFCPIKCSLEFEVPAPYTIKPNYEATHLFTEFVFSVRWMARCALYRGHRMIETV